MRILQMIAHEIAQTYRVAEISLINEAWTALTHYRWPCWLERIDAAKLVRSMSRKASSQDNAACEGFFGRQKNEFSYPRDWRAFTAAQFIDEVYAYFRWYNETRIKMPLGRRSPIEYRKSLDLMP